MAWRVARSLDTLLSQLNRHAPARSKRSDGSIGDAAHASRSSDHNPWYGPGIVTARDFTHDPLNRMDCNKLAEALRVNRDPRVKYVIWNRRIMSGAAGPSPWVWRAYSGSNPHTSHLHLSVEDAPSCDSVTLWRLSPLVGTAPVPVGDLPTLMLTDPYTKHAAVKELAEVLNAWYPNSPWGESLPEDTVYGPAKEDAVRYFQTAARLTVDGIVGPATWRALGIS